MHKTPTIRRIVAALALLVCMPLGSGAEGASGSAIFIHPDGMGASTWMAVRLSQVSPDGRLAWDRLPHAAVYVGPLRDRLHASSDGGATTHAYGLRAEMDSYGTLGGKPIAPARSCAASPHRDKLASRVVARTARRRTVLLVVRSLRRPTARDAACLS